MADIDGSYKEALSEDDVNTIKEVILARRRATTATDVTSRTVNDRTWVRQAFLVDKIDLDKTDQINRNFNSAEFKFLDSSLGGNYAINPTPQFTPYADIRFKGLLKSNQETTIGESSGKLGLGGYYNEAIDETSQVIHMRFGTPVFNSLTTFFTGFYNGEAAAAARGGRFTYEFFRAGASALGLVVSVVYFPILAFSILGAAYNFFFDKNKSKFYYMKPTMFSYWLAVNGMVNQIAVNKGLYKRTLLGDNEYKPSASNTDQEIGAGFRIDKNHLEELSTLMPDIFDKDGAIDVFSIAGRAQRIKVAFDDQIAKAWEQGEIPDFLGYVEKLQGEKLPDPSKPTIWTSIERWMNTQLGGASRGADGSVKGDDGEMDLREASQKSGDTGKRGFLSDIVEHFINERNDGGQFASFRVDYTGPVSESFSNSTVESDLAQKFNSTSSQARAARFTFADGNFMGGPVGAAVGLVADAAKGLMAGTLDWLNISGLMALGGSAFVDIPKHWESSTASLPKANYTMTLISPYGNVISQMTNIYIPLAMILTAALPLSTGRQSHTSPFLVELYDKGRQQTRLGMIDSLNITRGVSNLGFNKESEAMAIEVSFSVADLSSVMSMPIAPGFSFGTLINPTQGLFDDETVYTDYMAVLSSLGLSQQIYKVAKLQLRLAQANRRRAVLSSPAAINSFMTQRTPVGVLDMFYRGVTR